MSNDNTSDLEAEQQDEEQEEQVEETTEEQTEEETTEQSDDSEESDDTDWKAEALKYKAISERKAKQANKPKKIETETQAKKIEITPMDSISLMEAKVTNVDDINEVLDYARFKNVPVLEALDSDVVKTMLANKTAERKTANATSTKGGKRGAHKPSGDELISEAGEGKFPDDPDDLAQARIDKKKSKK